MRLELELLAPGFDCDAGEGALVDCKLNELPPGCDAGVIAVGWVLPGTAFALGCVPGTVVMVGTLAVGAGAGTVAVGTVGIFAEGCELGATAEG